MPGKRPYDSTRRAAQAQATRRRIIAAATECFASTGYAATTMHAVAAAAQVSVASIELMFGTKAQLLKAVIDVAIAGDEATVPMLDRAWAARAQATPDAREFLTVVSRTVRPAMTRSAALVLAVFDADGAAGDMSALAARLAANRAGTVAWIVDGLRARARLRPGLTRRAAIDEVWLLMDPAVYQRLTVHRGWSARRYETWFVDAVARLLLA